MKDQLIYFSYLNIGSALEYYSTEIHTSFFVVEVIAHIYSLLLAFKVKFFQHISAYIQKRKVENNF